MTTKIVKETLKCSIIILLSLTAGVWSSPHTTGSQPPPCSGFSFTAIDCHRAVLFGGYSPEHGTMNDVYIFNIQTMVCHCTNVVPGNKDIRTCSCMVSKGAALSTILIGLHYGWYKI